MKKISSCIVALIATISLSATTYTPAPGERTIQAIVDNGLADGDVIELSTGTYTEWKALEFTTKVTIKAAEGAKPQLTSYAWKIKNDFEVNGIAFTNASKDNYILRTGGDVAGTITIKNCSFQPHAEVSDPKAFIYLSNNTVGSLIIDGCVFKNNTATQGAVLTAEQSPVTNFTMTNSTVYDCGSTGDLEVYLAKCSNAYVDHCTFYNCAKRPLYINGSSLTSCVVKNCVIASATETSNYCIATYSGTVDNCVYFNTSAPRSSSSTNTNCVNADPLFTDAANGDLNFAFTSPLFLGGTDGKHIGDPRWTTKATSGEVIPGTLTAATATLAGPKIALTENGIAWNDQNDPTLNSASWVIDIDKIGSYKFVINVSANSTTTHYYSINIYDNNGLVTSQPEAYSTSGTGARSVGNITFDKPGKYMVRLTNATQWSSAIVESVTITCDKELVQLDETATENSILQTYYTSQTKIDVQILRTIKANEYNTFCLPFSLTGEQIAASNLAGAEILCLSSASLEGDALYLNFEDTTAIMQGKPYLVKPSSDIVHPIFNDVRIATRSGKSKTAGDVTFYASFIQQTISASDKTLVVANNLLYSLGKDVTLKGYRGYLKIADASPAPKRTYIRTQPTVVTDVEQAVEIQQVQKAIENGHIVIRIQGEAYDLSGRKL